MTARAPLVGIGLPVFNGAAWIEGTVEAIRRQTWRDWELVIVDNASTDATLKLCRHLEGLDTRIRVYANTSNIGISANHNRAFQLARGDYFKWSACADLIAPEYLEACVEALESNPRAVLCHSRTRMIDAEGRVFGGYDDGFALAEASPLARFVMFLSRPSRNNDVHGVIRRDALAETRLMEGFRQDDINLIADLALRGCFLLVDRPLFYRRETSQTDSQHMSDEQIDHYFAPDGQSLRWQAWRKYQSLARIAWSSAIPPPMRVRALLQVSRMAWWSKQCLLEEVRRALLGRTVQLDARSGNR